VTYPKKVSKTNKKGNYPRVIKSPKGIKKALTAFEGINPSRLLSYAQQGIKAAHTAFFPWQP